MNVEEFDSELVDIILRAARDFPLVEKVNWVENQPTPECFAGDILNLVRFVKFELPSEEMREMYAHTLECKRCAYAAGELAYNMYGEGE